MVRDETFKKVVQEYLKKEQTDMGKLICPLMSWHQPTIIFCVGFKCACWDRENHKCGFMKG